MTARGGGIGRVAAGGWRDVGWRIAGVGCRAGIGGPDAGGGTEEGGAADVPAAGIGRAEGKSES